MQILFKNPEYLYGLFLVIIPIIIHLFNFKRYKTVYFSDVSFLSELQRKTKSMSQLKHWLVLTSRILFIVSLVLIFAQPYIPSNLNQKTNKNNRICIYIDNSFSSSNESNKGKVIEQAKQKAVDIANAFKTGKKYLLITNDLSPRFNHFVNYEQFLNFVSEVDVSSKNLDISQVISFAKDISDSKQSNLYVISDFQQTFLNKKNIENDSNLLLTLIPVEITANNNLSVDTCYFPAPYHKYKGEEHLKVKIKSYSEKDYSNIVAKLYINDSLRAINNFDINAHSSQDIDFVFTNTEKGIYKGEIRIDDFPVVFDNSLYFSYEIKQKLKVLIINSKDSSIVSKIYKTDNYFDVKNINYTKLKFSELANYDLIILNNLTDFSTGLTSFLNKFTQMGKNIILIPEVSEKYIKNYNSFLQEFGLNKFTNIDSINTRLGTVNRNSDLYSVFESFDNKTVLPKLQKFYMSNNAGNYAIQNIITSENGKALLSEATVNNGKFFIFYFNASSKNEKGFIKSPLMFASFFNIALQSNKTTMPYFSLSSKIVKIKKLPEPPIILQNSSNDEKIIPLTKNEKSFTKLYISNIDLKAGNYTISKNDSLLTVISFNYPRNESVMNFMSPKVLQEFIANNHLTNWQIVEASDSHLTQSIKQQAEGVALWYYFVISALLFILIEMILLSWGRFVR